MNASRVVRPPTGGALPMTPRPLARLRTICLALPEAHEVESHGEPTFRVRNKMFATFANAAVTMGKGGTQCGARQRR